MAKGRPFGSISQRKNRPGFTIRFPYQGKEIARSAGLATRKDARGKLKKVQALLQGGGTLASVDTEVFGRPQAPAAGDAEPTFLVTAGHYLDSAKEQKKASTFKVDRFRMRAICRAPWAQLPLDQITPSKLQEWRSEQKSSGIGGPAINNNLSLISQVFRWAIKRDHTGSNPVRRVDKYPKKNEGRKVHLTPEQTRALLAEAQAAFRPMITFAVITGIRKGAILKLQWRSVDFERRLITVEASTTKSKKTRVVPMDESVEDILQGFWAARADEKVIKSDRSDPVFSSWKGQRFNEHTVRRMMEQAVLRCTELPEEMRTGNRDEKLTFHSLRHTAITQMLESGMSIFEVSKIVGHSTTKMTETYGHLTPEMTTRARGVMSKMGSKLTAPGGIGLKSGTGGKTG